MNPFLAAAAAASLLTCLVHLVLGGREVARPLLATEGLRRIPKFTAYYCWHLVTITLSGLALAFALAARPDGSRELALFATGGAALFAVWSLGMVARFRLRPWHFPQWALFLPITALGLAGVLR
jgi:hypothetical protein